MDHIEITVKDMKIAVPFYDKLLPLLGFDVQNRVSAVIEEHEKQVVQYEHPRSRAEVDRLHSELKGIGATIVSPPREYPACTPPGYYALFFKDLEGLK